MRIGELSKRTGVDIETIRYYEREGLLPPPAREANGYRHYRPLHEERLRFIRHCRALEMSLSDTNTLLGAMAEPKAGCDQISTLIEHHLSAVHERVEQLKALEQQLQTLRSRCDHSQTVAECGIAENLQAAAQGEPCVCHNDLKKAKQ
jgi:Cd(II)/Pb(II)-responsive transcriptional regulator